MKCPVATAMEYLGKKWTLEIIRDLFLGKKHFNKILESNQKAKSSLSGKVLTDRLKELKENGIIEKEVLKSFPISIEYHLTKKGEALNKVIYELAAFGCNCHDKYEENEKMLGFLRKALRIDKI